MRGSPVFRSLAVLLVLILAAFGIRALSRAPSLPAGSDPPAAAPDELALTRVPFFLTFSSAPSRVRIESGDQVIELTPEGVHASGTLRLGGKFPNLFLTITWDNSSPDLPRFAKLTLEPEGQATRSRIFEGFGEIEDVWELATAR